MQVLAGLAAFIAASAGVAADGSHPQARAQRIQQTQADAEDVLAAVVRIKMTAIANARSSANLGQSREGTGVVIDERGHIVTIGYIVIEADSIEITTQDDRTVPATLVGYDHASGFGLLRSSVPLGVRPIPMGQAADLALREPVMILPAGGREMASLAYVVSKRKF